MASPLAHPMEVLVKGPTHTHVVQAPVIAQHGPRTPFQTFSPPLKLGDGLSRPAWDVEIWDTPPSWRWWNTSSASASGCDELEEGQKQ